MIKITQLPVQLVQAAELVSFTTAISGTVLPGNANPVTSAAVVVAAGKALLVSYESAGAGHFITDISKDGGVTWQNLSAFHQPDTLRRSVHAITTNDEPFQVRFVAASESSPSTTAKVAYQVRG
jgi:hypothetical protein